ncbi:hypothetical protein F8388_022849 [Cannabis sativa]|uniref:Ycf2 N-terminal domain-containing protein n=1 Tax=Cannabis sativa TaxID=3483 RepID=A0A7J6FBZ4_CANSA|nr:hypothetical protein F8388_022849 [Cannabis sativa]
MKFRCLWAISNETVAGIEISFKEKDTKYLEFLFVYYMDDLIREDHDWELFDRLSPRKRRNIINLTHNHCSFSSTKAHNQSRPTPPNPHRIQLVLFERKLKVEILLNEEINGISIVAMIWAAMKINLFTYLVLNKGPVTGRADVVATANIVAQVVESKLVRLEEKFAWLVLYSCNNKPIEF